MAKKVKKADKSAKKEKTAKKAAVGRASKYDYPKGIETAADKKKYRAEQRNGGAKPAKASKKEVPAKKGKEGKKKEGKALIMKKGKKVREEKVSTED